MIEAVERFHLVFLQTLGGKLDKSLFAVKGGCNLRFFFGSNRYSEDIDLDVVTVAKATLQKKVSNLLASRPFALQLGPGLTVTSAVAAKQTETTQRWKVELRTATSQVRTKIEFSRRSQRMSGVQLAQIDPRLTANHRLPPIVAPHYGAEAACLQKIVALADRSETQARDLFDLNILLPHVKTLNTSLLPPGKIQAAVAQAQTLDFATFKGQVWAYLPPHDQADWKHAELWQQTVTRICAQLAGLAATSNANAPQ